ncbi:MAG: hypothetical protein QNJ33_19565 [Crocosphaera sp.]|nr:hypothetical protein [Crocosphaera sp.]
MNSQTFEVEVKDGILVIPPEIQDYLRQCQGNTKVSITIISSLENSDNIKEKWERWFDEVEKIELSPSRQQTFLEKFDKLSNEQQKDVLEFLDIIDEDVSETPTNLERKEAKEILQRAKERAKSNVSKSVDELWSDFNQVKDKIASEFENK